MRHRAYIYLPEEDDDFLRIGNNPEDYISIVKSVALIRELLKKIDAEFWYDSYNLKEFASKSNILVGGKYLSNIESQLRRIFGNTAQDITAVKISNKECVYLKWNSDFSHVTIKPLLIEAAEFAISNIEIYTAIINISDAIVCERDTYNVIKDAVHLNGLPVLIRIPLFRNEYDLNEWITSTYSKTSFSLRDKSQFQATGKFWIKQMIYLEKNTGNFWYYDFYHKENKEHFEVFDESGDHIGEADKEGKLLPNSKDNNKKIGKII